MPGKKVLLVEGTDDENVIKHICGNRGVNRLDEITPQRSVERLLENFPVRLKESEIEVLGLVLDADTDLAGRWAALKHRLAQAGYDRVPNQPAADGTIVDPPLNSLLPRFGVWIMPDNRSKGILEDFLRFLVPGGSQLFEHVKSSVASIPEGERRFGQLAEPKAIIHTWLAWQKEPGKPLGTSIRARFLDPNVAEVDVLVAWLKQLFFP
jgi:hypothetical protein